MGAIAMNEKELLLIDTINKEKNRTEEEKQCRVREFNIDDKENKQRSSIKSATEELERCFCNSFEKYGTQTAILGLSLKSTRDDILAHIPESRIEYDYLNENYEKILNKIKKIYINDEKAKMQLQQIEIQKQAEQEQLQREKDEKFERTCNAIGSILKWSLIIIFAPIILLFMFIAGLSKGK